MSLHVLHHECGHVERNGDRSTFWTAWCDCGWEGGKHWLSERSEAADAARHDYAQHINEAMGAEGFYSACVGCTNCGSRHEQGVLVGTPVYSMPCSNCGQRMLRPDNDVKREADENAIRWRF